MRAALYSRFSTDRQNESSIADQVRVCAEYADRQGWQVVERFEDQGISGAALGTHPGVLGFNRPRSRAGSMPCWSPTCRGSPVRKVICRR